MFTEHKGNLFDVQADAFAHGVNTEGLMGAGIAVEFKDRWPRMYKSYKALCQTGGLEPGHVWAWDNHMALPRLGCVRTTQEIAKREAELAAMPKPRWIYNIASQDMPGRYARLMWVESGVREMLAHAADNSVGVIAMPRIGCGIGGLKWDHVRDILEHYGSQTYVDLQVWTHIPKS